MANFPTSKDDSTSLPNPSGINTQNNPDHGALHTNENAAIIALENKLGTGATTPTANTLLLGTDTGTSAWSQATSAQVAASVSDETGTGSLVFGTAPTLITPKVDTINESTPSNGVTVGGVNLKNGAVGSNGVVTTSITDGTVIPAKLFAGTGSTWTWQSWTPTWTNLTVGNGIVQVNLYTQVGRVVFFKVEVIFGTTTSVSGIIIVSLPVTTSAVTVIPIGTAICADNSAGNAEYMAMVEVASSTTVRVKAHNASGTYTTLDSTSATVPFTWATGDQIYIVGTYQA